MNLFKVLFISWSIGASLSYFKGADISYQAKCLSMSVFYLFWSGFCYQYIIKELKLNKILSAYMVSALCMCMVVSSWFNFLFVSPDIYYALIDIRRGGGFSWENIYKTIEIAALLMVGRNGLIYIYNWLICRSRRINVIIANNSTYNIGR